MADTSGLCGDLGEAVGEPVKESPQREECVYFAARSEIHGSLRKRTKATIPLITSQPVCGSGAGAVTVISVSIELLRYVLPGEDGSPGATSP